jgi:acyl-CoA thioester hydrolase
MLERPDLEPAFFAPFVSSVMRVEPGWIDYNGHLNMAYYNVLFDRAGDEAFDLLGCGAGYAKAHGLSTFTAEAHVRYLREVRSGDPVRVTFQLFDYDAKRMHYFEQLFHAEEGWLSATSENMVLHGSQCAQDRGLSRCRRCSSRPHEGGACAFAGARRRRSPHRDAREALTGGMHTRRGFPS